MEMIKFISEGLVDQWRELSCDRQITTSLKAKLTWVISGVPSWSVEQPEQS